MIMACAVEVAFELESCMAPACAVVLLLAVCRRTFTAGAVPTAECACTPLIRATHYYYMIGHALIISGGKGPGEHREDGLME